MPSRSTTVTLVLHGGSNATSSACGAQHHYRVYAAGTTIAFSGSVTPIPTGHWKVKLKLKVCRGAAFVELTKLDSTRNRHTGAFTGSFPAPPAGSYEARAELYVDSVQETKGDKRHFAIR